MTEQQLNKDIKRFLDKHNIMYEKEVASGFNKSGKSDLTITLPNGKLCYVELKGFNSKHPLTTLQKIFLMLNSQSAYCFYINSLQTYNNFKDFIMKGDF